MALLLVQYRDMGKLCGNSPWLQADRTHQCGQTHQWNPWLQQHQGDHARQWHPAIGEGGGTETTLEFVQKRHNRKVKGV